MTNIIFAIYGILMIVGGIIGFTKAGSKISLIAGVVSGIAVFLALFLMKSYPQQGVVAVAGISGLLTVTFLMRYLKIQNFMPSGMLALLSLVVLIISIVQLLQK